MTDSLYIPYLVVGGNNLKEPFGMQPHRCLGILLIGIDNRCCNMKIII